MEGTKEGAFVRSAVPPVGEGGGINKAITATTMKERKEERKEENVYEHIEYRLYRKRMHSTFLRNLLGVGRRMTNGIMQRLSKLKVWPKC